jgi:predicted metal-dependent peptidase
MNSYASIDEAAVDLVYHAPFYAHILAGLRRRSGPTSTLLAEGAKVLLAICPTDLAKRSKPEARGLLKHELLHVLLGHPVRRSSFPDTKRFDLAADLVVNALLDDDERTPDDLLPRDFGELNLPPSGTVEDYYRLLPPTPAEEKDPENGEATATVTAETGEADGEDDGQTEGHGGLPNQGRRSHDGWTTFDEGSALEKMLREAYIAAVTEEAYSRGTRAGNVSSKLLRALQLALARKAAADWRTVLRRFRASAETTRIRSTIQRPSRRFGTVPGTRIQRLCRLVVCIDTSGSLSAEDLGIIDAELRHLARTDAQIQLIFCDAAVVGEAAFRGALPTYVPGGGGTLFDPALLAAEKYDPDGIVYFTDGWVSAVHTRPKAPVLWVLTPAGRALDEHARALLPGRIVKMQ